MMLSKVVQDAFNEQINHELYSAYLYLSMSAHFESTSLPGFARWTRIQAEEEKGHALKLFNFVNDRGGKVLLKAIDQPPSEFGSPLQVFQAILAHEQKVTGLIHKLYETALKENDYPTQVMLGWFISEQVEEEKNATLIVEQLIMMEDHKAAIINIDHHIGKRGSD